MPNFSPANIPMVHLHRVSLSSFMPHSVLMLGFAMTQFGGPCTNPCCTSWDSQCSTSPVCQDPSGWHIFPLAYQLHHSAWCHPKSCLGCTQSHYAINKDTDQHESQYRPQRDTICSWSPFGHWDLNWNSLGAAVEPTTYPSKNPPIKPTSLLFNDRDVVSILAEVKVDDISQYSLIYQSSHSV